MPQPPENEPRKFVLKQKQFERINAPETTAPNLAPNPTDIHATLRGNIAAQEAAAPEILDLSRRPSRRKRDYWTTLLLLDGTLAAAVLLLPRDPIYLVFALSGFVIATLGLTWIFWFVMDDY